MKSGRREPVTQMVGKSRKQVPTIRDLGAILPGSQHI